MARARSPRTELGRLLDASPSPLAVVGEDRRIVFVNAALCALSSTSAEELVGQTCNYHSAEPLPLAQRQAAALCPPPDLDAAAAAEERVITLPLPEGRWTRRRARFVPLASAAAAGRATLVLLGEEEFVPAPGPAEAAAGDAPGDVHRHLAEFRRAHARRYHLDLLIGRSEASQQVRNQMRLAMEAGSRVVVVGPRGSGREHVARTIHYGGGRLESAGPLVPLDCELLDAELLRTTAAAFIRRCAELATERPGALLLLEADALPRDAQAELAGLLNLPELEIRFLATARRPLIDLAREEAYRADVAYGLSTLVIELPPLCRRPEDIPLLAQAMLEQCNAAGGKQVAGFAPEALDRLAGYPWPGNLEELEALVRGCHQRAAGAVIQAAELPPQIALAESAAAHPPRRAEGIVLADVLADVERELIRRALRRCRGNKAKAARSLGIHRARLLRRIEQLGLAEEGGAAP